uniref:Ciliary associated calcium binding coiled-coil 1 n=1 Tax=Capra hircus TaxID=9925 RepID=A0A8C2QZQ9_CAPHI
PVYGKLYQQDRYGKSNKIKFSFIKRNYFNLAGYLLLTFSVPVQLIEVVNPADHPFPDPLEEGISFDVYSTFIEPPPPLDMEIKGLNQEQGPEESQPEADTSETDLLVGFTIEEIKSVLDQVTDDILISIQTEINEKLQIQEEAFNARIEKLKKA